MPILAPLLAAAAPFILWPVELLFPYPYIWEEIYKLGLVVLAKKEKPPARRQVLKSVLLLGLVFSFSENIFYLFNTFQLNSWEFFIKRLILTSLLHTSTCLILAYIPLGLVFSILIHYFYNRWIGATIGLSLP